jgi:hypothetical protein
MPPIEAITEHKHHHHHHSEVSLQHERRRILKMKVIFGVFSAVLLLSLVLSWLLSH